MALNYFIGWSIQKLETALAAAQEDLAAGASIESAGSGDVNSRNKTELSPQERIKMILKALNLADPDSYPASTSVAITRTRINFAQGETWQSQPTE
jgi:hypothetical protein